MVNILNRICIVPAVFDTHSQGSGQVVGYLAKQTLLTKCKCLMKNSFECNSMVIV